MTNVGAILVAAEYVGKGKEENGWVSLYLRTDKRFNAIRFNAKVGSDIYLAFEALEEGQFITVATSTPKVATSQAGKPYLSWFLVSVPKVQEA